MRHPIHPAVPLRAPGTCSTSTTWADHNVPAYPRPARLVTAVSVRLHPSRPDAQPRHWSARSDRSHDRGASHGLSSQPVHQLWTPRGAGRATSSTSGPRTTTRSWRRSRRVAKQRRVAGQCERRRQAGRRGALSSWSQPRRTAEKTDRRDRPRLLDDAAVRSYRGHIAESSHARWHKGVGVGSVRWLLPRVQRSRHRNWRGSSRRVRSAPHASARCSVVPATAPTR
jgi:hypothetical protein